MRITVEQFLDTILPSYERLTLLAGETGSYKYFRTEKDGMSYIVMDAPPERENAGQFVQIATAFSQAGVNVPDIIEDDLDNGYLLLSDFGDDQLQHFVATDPQHWLPICLGKLFDFQLRGGQHILELPLYDQIFLLSELSLFPEWFVTELLNERLSAEEETQLNDLHRLLIDNALNQPQTWVHWDYHSRNLMKIGENDLGVIGFQNAMLGSITYDLASILKDCYVRYPKAVIREQLEQYYIRLVGHDKYFQDFDQFERNFDLMGLQRHLKILGGASKQCLQNNSPMLLNDLPLVFDYVFEVVQKYPELQHYLPLFERLGIKFEQKVLF